jgi:hypothetical protein
MYVGDAALLERLPPRKEFRRTRDLMRLSSEQIDDRSLVLETPWFGMDATDGESDPDGEDKEEEEAVRSGADEEEVTDEDGLEAESGAESGVSEGSASEEDDDSDSDSDSDDDDNGENAGADEGEMSPDARSSPTRKHKRPPPSLPPTPPKPHLGPARPAKKKPDTTTMAVTTR